MLGSSRYRKRNITCCGTRNLGVLVGKARLGPKKEADVGKSEQNGTPQPLPTRCDRRALLLRVEAVEQALEGRLPLGGDDVEESCVVVGAAVLGGDGAQVVVSRLRQG
jgi:hypothetical protein